MSIKHLFYACFQCFYFCIFHFFSVWNGPQLWLDKACIDQTAIESDLQCLPVFLAGCDTLLILAGKTYTQRLWCVLEMFVFLHMGGSVDRIVVIPINMADEAEAKAMFDQADVGKSQCYLETDRQRLLGIIEVGFGNFDAFNDIIRNVFHKRLSESAHYTSKIVSRLFTRKHKITPTQHI